MTEEQAKKLIKEVFEKPFDKNQFIRLMLNLLNFEKKTFVYKGNTIWESFKPFIKTCERVGQYKDPKGKIIDILIVHLKKETSLERARSRQRNFIAKYLKGSRGGILKDGALVAFVSPQRKRQGEKQGKRREETQGEKQGTEQEKRWEETQGEKQGTEQGKRREETQGEKQGTEQGKRREETQGEKQGEKQGKDWRFSFIKIDYQFDEKGKVKDDLTPARRYSFLVGENESSHTAQSCFLDLLKTDSKTPDLKTLEDVFSVETVTREFFEKYRTLFHTLKETLDDIIAEDTKIKAEFLSKKINSSDFSKKLLGQIVFLYFLQKKGWFGVRRGSEWGTGSKHFLRQLFNNRHQIYTVGYPPDKRQNSFPPDKKTASFPPDNGKKLFPPDKGGKESNRGGYPDKRTASFPPDKGQKRFPPDKGGQGGSSSNNGDTKSNQKSNRGAYPDNGTGSNFPPKSYENFFKRILEPLFYEALGQEHVGDYYSRFDCRIPFLNGGLFEPINNYDWINTDIFLPDHLFSNTNKTKEGDTGNGILDIFDRYNFTVNEDEPLEKEVAIDPEMLGKVFENLLEVRDRKSKGTYYTPREIVHYMCQESLINYLAEELKGKVKKEAIEKFIKISDSSLEHDTIYQEKHQELASHTSDSSQGKSKNTAKKHTTNRGRYSKSQLPESIIQHAHLIDKALAEIKVCDPAVGSAAFPVGMMNEIVRARSALTPSIPLAESSTPPDKETSSSPPDKGGKESNRGGYPDKRTNSSPPDNGKKLFPPDKGGQGGFLDKRQDSFLSDKGDLRTPYHFKRFCIEHSLYGVDIDPSAIEIAKLRLWFSLVVDEEDRSTVQPLPNLDYKMVCGNSLLGLHKSDGSDGGPGTGTSDAFYQENLNKLHQKKNLYFNETYISKKQKLKKEIDQLIDKICVRTVKRSDKSIEKQKAFDFKIYFSEVFQAKQGFDIVIANPPYVEHKKLKGISQLLKSYETYSGTADLYIYFYEKGLEILKEKGVLTYISSNKFIKARYGINIKKLLSKYKIYTIVDFTKIHVFNALVASCIFIVSKSKSVGNILVSLPDDTFSGNLSDFIMKNHLSIPCRSLKQNVWYFENKSKIDLKNKIEKNTKKLGEIQGIKIFRGVTTGYNPAFIIGTDVRDELIKSDAANKKIIKPLLQGRNIKKWFFNKSKSYILLTDYDIDILDLYPTIFQYLEKFKQSLIIRADKGKNWWNLRSCKYYNEFENPKIIWGLTANKWAFAWDEDKNFLPSNGYILTSKKIHLKYILSLMNSSLMKFYFSFVGIMTAGGAFTLKHETIFNFPIKDSSHRDKNLLIDLVNKILKITKTKDYLQNPGLQAKVREYEKQIDQLVYKLYKLTPSEIKIIEDNSK